MWAAIDADRPAPFAWLRRPLFAAAAVAAVVVLILLVPRSEMLVRSGELIVAGQPAAELPLGAPVHARTEVRAGLAAGELVLQPGTELTVTALDRVALELGTLDLSVTAAITAVTPEVRVATLGGRLRIERTPGRTRVDLLEGTAHLERKDHPPQTLRAGQFAIVTAGAGHAEATGAIAPGHDAARIDAERARATSAAGHSEAVASGSRVAGHDAERIDAERARATGTSAARHSEGVAERSRASGSRVAGHDAERTDAERSRASGSRVAGHDAERTDAERSRASGSHVSEHAARARVRAAGSSAAERGALAGPSSPDEGAPAGTSEPARSEAARDPSAAAGAADGVPSGDSVSGHAGPDPASLDPPPGGARAASPEPAVEAASRRLAEARAVVRRDAPRARAIAEGVLQGGPAPAVRVEATMVLADALRLEGQHRRAATAYGRVVASPEAGAYREEAILRQAQLLGELGDRSAALQVLAKAEHLTQPLLAPERAALAADLHLSERRPYEAAAILTATKGTARPLQLARLRVARALPAGDRVLEPLLRPVLQGTDPALASEARALTGSEDHRQLIPR